MLAKLQTVSQAQNTKALPSWNHLKVQIYDMIPSLPARAPCLAPTDPRRPSPALSTHRFNFQPKCLLPVFVQTLIVAPSNQADMALSALYLHNVNHRAAARPSLGQLSAYNFQVMCAISSYNLSGKEIFSERAKHFQSPTTHPPHLQCLLQTGGTNDGRQ